MTSKQQRAPAERLVADLHQRPCWPGARRPHALASTQASRPRLQLGRCQAQLCVVRWHTACVKTAANVWHPNPTYLECTYFFVNGGHPRTA